MAMMLLGFCAAGELRAQEVFQKWYNLKLGYYSHDGNNIVQTSDSGYFAVARTAGDQSQLTKEGLILLKINKKGDVTWCKIIPNYQKHDSTKIQDNFLIPGNVIQTRDGGFCISGWNTSTAITGGNNRFGFLLRTDSLGTVLWTKQYYYKSGRDSWFQKVLEDENGNFMISGREISSYRLFLSTDSIGNVIWAKNYLSFNGSLDLERTHDGNYISGGSSGLVKIDPKGNVIWSKAYGDFINRAKPTADGGFIISVRRNIANVSSLYNDAGLIKTDSSGNVEWARMYPHNDEYLTSSGQYVLPLTNGSYFLNGFSRNCENCVKPWFMLLTSDGSLASAKSIRTYGFTYESSVTKDGGIISAGLFKKDTVSPEQFFIVKNDTTNSLYCPQNEIKRSFKNVEFTPIVKDSPITLESVEFLVSPLFLTSLIHNIGTTDLCSTTDITTFEKPQAFSISPNPASQTVTISLKELPLTADISIIDITGKTLYRTFLKDPGQKIPLHISPLLKGIYFVKVIADGQEFTQKLVVE